MALNCPFFLANVQIRFFIEEQFQWMESKLFLSCWTETLKEQNKTNKNFKIEINLSVSRKLSRLVYVQFNRVAKRTYLFIFNGSIMVYSVKGKETRGKRGHSLTYLGWVTKSGRTTYITPGDTVFPCLLSLPSQPFLLQCGYEDQSWGMSQATWQMVSGANNTHLLCDKDTGARVPG